MMNKEIQKKLDALTEGKNFKDLALDKKEKILSELIKKFGLEEVQKFFKNTGQTDSQEEKSKYDTINTGPKNIKFTPDSYKQHVESNEINTDIFSSTLDFLEIFFPQKKKLNDSDIVKTGKSSEDKKDDSYQKSSVESKSMQNIELAIAIRELLSSFDTQGISEAKITGLKRFREEFKKVLTPSLPPERKINDSGTQIVSSFKSEVIASEDAIARLKELKTHRLTTPVSELFDFVLYLKDSSHKSIRDIEIRDDEDRLSYHYYTGRKNDEYIYLDDILFGNIGLVWQDDCSDDTKLKITDCLRLQRERNGERLKAEFDSHKTKDAKIYACYTISQNPYLSKKLASEVLGITESAFEYFPYPKDFQAMIDAIHTNIYRKFPDVALQSENNNKDEKTAFEKLFEAFEKLDDAIWHPGMELSINEHRSKKTVLAKKLGETNNDYRKYIQLKSEWLWSIADIMDTFWVDDYCYGIELTKSQIVEYAFFALCEARHDDIINHLKQKLIDSKKHESLLLKDYDFDILAGILSISANIHLIIRRLLAVSTGKSEKEKLYKVYSDWLDTVDDILGKNPEELIGKIEEHPDLYGDLWYSFQEIWTGMRFWLNNYEIGGDRMLKLAEDGWNREKYYFDLRHEKADYNMSMSLFTYLIVCYCFGCEDNKKKALEDMRSMSSEIVKAVAKNIEDELKSFGSASNKYKKALEDLKGVLMERNFGLKCFWENIKYKKALEYLKGV
ncbi:MAG TPA: hypothetical protein PKW30_01915, partial [Campylobacterales bacterium]|nr:hypothetical protein [Campylobacterales bacterium]